MAEVLITEFTDPGCPWAYSAEPFRWRLNWLYGDKIEWQVRLVVLADSADEYLEKGFDTKLMASAYKLIAREHGMPIDTSERPRMHATLPACRAVIAAREHAPEHAWPLLRALRIRGFAGGLLDDPETLAGAAVDAGLDPAELERWSASTDVSEDKALARSPSPAALALDHKLADWEGGRRYTCPSYEIERVADGARLSAPGFQPFAAYEVAVANLLPEAPRRAAPESVEEVLAWAGTPLASKEVAELCGLDVPAAREALGRVATERHVGADGFWSLRS